VRAAACTALLAALPLVSAASPGQGRFVQETLAGEPVRYTLAVPREHAPQHAVPLVVSLHYGGPVSPWYGRGLLEAVVEPALRPLGAVMVAPDCPQPAWADCAQALARVIDHVQSHYRTRADCVLLTGYSKGGIGAWALAARDTERYAGAVVMAARAPERAILESWRLPVRAIHGADDELFPARDAAAAIERLREAGVDAGIEVLPGVSHYDTHRFAGPLARQVDWLRERCAR